METQLSDRKAPLRCRVCLRCKEYVVIHEGYAGEIRIQKFEKEHRAHPLITTELKDASAFVNVSSRFN
jgi:hypothetical protein